MSKSTPPQQLHIPVLLSSTIELLDPQVGESYLDLTAGYGGHASAVLSRTQAPDKAVLVDRDRNALDELAEFESRGVRLEHDDFAHAASALARTGRTFDMILVDLGVSSPQLDRDERGFSFRLSGPLDMRMDQRQQRTAADLVNRLSEQELVHIITKYGEESPGRARAIARAITSARPITTTDQLASVILKTHRGPWQKVHPATRTFQALRIALNDELGQLETFLEVMPDLLSPGGRVAVISFHSLEDRLVKQRFNELTQAGYEAEMQLLTKKPIRGSTEDVHNPRARSALLRGAVKK